MDSEPEYNNNSEHSLLNRTIHIIGLVLLTIKVIYEWHTGEIQLTSSNIDGSRGTFVFTMFMTAQLAAIAYLLVVIFLGKNSSSTSRD